MANQEANLEKIDAVFLTKTTLQPDSAVFDKWTIKEFWVKETIGRPYHGTVDIISSYKSIDYSKLIGKSCVLKISRGAERERFFKGIVSRVEILGVQHGRSAAKVSFAPALHALEYGMNTRVFQDRTAPQIIEEVVKEALAPFERQVKMQVLRKYAVREYTVQYKESDFNFVSRLMVDEGLTFYYDQKSQEHEVIVVVDSNEAHVEVDTMGEKIVPVEPVTKGLEEWATAGQSAMDASNFVEIELTDQDGKPIAGAEYQLKLPNGRIADYRLNKDGWDSVPIAKHTDCQISFSNQLDWAPKGQKANVRNEVGADAMEYKAKLGDCFSTIAANHGVSLQRLWDHPKNKDLRDLRKNPNILFAGDRVFIPERSAHWEKCSTKSKNMFVAKPMKKLFKLTLLDGENKPVLGAAYKLAVGNEEFTGETKTDGVIMAHVDATAIKGSLSINGGPPKPVGIGFLNPMQDVDDHGVSGVQARLHNLGYCPGPIDGVLSPLTRSAIQAFQQENKMDVTGEISDALIKKLEEIYGC